MTEVEMSDRNGFYAGVWLYGRSPRYRLPFTVIRVKRTQLDGPREWQVVAGYSGFEPQPHGQDLVSWDPSVSRSGLTLHRAIAFARELADRWKLE